MAVVYANDVKQDRMQAVADKVPGGKIRVGTAGMATILAEWTLATPAGTAANAVLTWDMDPDLVATGLAAAGAGTVAVEGDIVDSLNNVKVSGLTVGAVSSGSDLELDNVSIADGQSATLATGTFTHAA